MGITVTDAELSQFAPEMDAQEAQDPAKLIAALNTYPYFVRIVGGAPTEETRQTEQLISPLVDGREAETTISRIEINPESQKEEGSGTRQSRSADAMDAHTDSSYRPHQHELLVFQHVRADASGGDSVIIALEDILEHVSDEDVELLEQTKFRFIKIGAPVLSRIGAARHVRFNITQIKKSNPGLAKHPEFEALLERFVVASREKARRFQFRAQPGETLMINNLRTLHGRTALAPDSDRLMMRIRARCKALR